MAEREGFEPPIAMRLSLISSQVHSTGLCHLTALSTKLPGVFPTTARWHWLSHWEFPGQQRVRYGLYQFTVDGVRLQ